MSKIYKFSEDQAREMIAKGFKAGYETSMDFKEQEVDNILTEFTNKATVTSGVPSLEECADDNEKTAHVKKTLRSIADVMKKQKEAQDKQQNG